ncbi:MAG: hypothetical protein ACI843_001063, partial [Psychrobacter glaciei]
PRVCITFFEVIRPVLLFVIYYFFCFKTADAVCCVFTQ